MRLIWELLFTEFVTFPIYDLLIDMGLIGPFNESVRGTIAEFL